MELLVYFLTDSIHFYKEYKQKSYVELLVISALISYCVIKEYKQKFSVELLVYFLTDLIQL